ncbi:MAG: hypothetical protein NTV85_28630 [Hyphomicrobiales bacterium]|nr:hypothetical protein [Hyphomicrobiales bacterium]
MPFIIQGQDVAAVPETQSPWYETDIAILVAGIAGTGVLTGCEVTAQGTPDMTVAVASGTIQPSAGVASVVVTGANKTITAADGDDPRIDLVSASAAGVLTVTDGTPAPVVPGVSGPKPPALPSGHIGLAVVDVPATDTTIGAAQITDKRVMVFASTGIADILDLPTAEMDDSLVYGPDGIGGVQARAEAGVGGVSGVTFPITIVIDGGGSAITGNPEVDVTIPAAGTITGWTLLADTAGDAVIDIWNDAYADYPPTVADTITAAALPTLSTAAKATHTTLTGWTKALAAGDVLRFHLNSSATVKRLELTLTYTRS